MPGASLTFDILAKDRASGTLDRVGKKVDGLSTRTVAFGSFIGNAMTGGVVALGKMGVAAAKMGIGTAASLEQAQVGFTTLIGSSQKAQTFLGKLQKFAAATPFELPGLIDSSRLLLGVGVSADKVIPMLTAFGDAAGAVGVSQDAFQRIMLATSQAISAGRFQVGDLNQIVTNGIPAWKLLSEATGKPVPVLRDLASKGKLLAKDVLPVLQKQMEKDYGGAMAKQSQTLSGVWSTLMDTLNIGLANVLKPLVPYLEQALPKAATLLGTVLSGTGKGVEVFLNAFTGKSELNEFDGALKVINNGAINLGAALRETQKAVGIFWDAFSGRSEINEFDGALKTANNAGITARQVFDTTVGAIKAFVDILGTSIGFVDRHRAILKTTIAVVLGLVAVTKAYNTALAVQAAGGVVQWLWQAVKAWKAVQLATEAATAAQWALNVAMDANPVGLVILAIGALVTAVALLWRNNETFRRITIQAWSAVQDAIGSAVDWITGTAWPAITGAWDAISDGAVGLWRQMVSIWDGIVGAVESGVHQVLDVGRSIGHGFAIIGRAFSTAADAVVGVFQAIGSAVAAFLAPIGQAFQFLLRIAQPVFDLLGIGWQIADRLTWVAIKSIQIGFILLGRLFSALAPLATMAMHAVGDAFTWLGHVAMIAVRAAGDGLTWLYSNVVKPIGAAIGAAARAVGAAFTWLWQVAAVPALHAIAVAARAVGDAATWLWRVALAPAISAIGSALQVAWTRVIRPALHGFEDAMRALGTTITTVWNKVILPAFNALKDFAQNRIVPAFKAGVKAIGEAWDGLKELAKEPVRFVVNTVINHGIIDTFNKVASDFGVKGVAHVSLPKGFASGGVFNEPTAIVGEGGPAPEYVIPTDRKYRKRALSLYEALGTKLMASGGVVGWLTDPIGSLRGAVSPWMDKLNGITGGPLGQLAAAVPRRLVSGMGDYLGHLAAKAMSSFSGGGGSAEVRRIGQRLAAQAGWSSAAQWSALDSLWTHESGWNPRARNPSSSAWGVPQFLKSTAGAYGLAYGDTDPVHQINAGLKYIRDAYGNPLNAWQKWQSRSPHWYGNGGTITEPILGRGLRTGRAYGFGERGPETVIPGRGGGGGDIHLHLHHTGPIGSQQQLEDWLAQSLEQLRRKNRLPRRA